MVKRPKNAFQKSPAPRVGGMKERSTSPGDLAAAVSSAADFSRGQTSTANRPAMPMRTPPRVNPDTEAPDSEMKRAPTMAPSG